MSSETGQAANATGRLAPAAVRNERAERGVTVNRGAWAVMVVNIPRWIPALAFALALLPGASPAAAADGDAAARAQKVKALTSEALGHFEDGEYEEALALYREAHALWGLPAISFMVARSLEGLERHAEAVAVLERALAEGPDPALKGRVDQKLADLRASLAEGRLLLLVEPAGAQVTVDGEPRGETPLPPLRLAPGTYELVFTHPDHYEETRSVEVVGGREVTVSVELNPLPVEEEPELPTQDWYTSTWGWVSAGTGLAALAAGTALLVVAEGERDDVRGLRDEDPVRSMSQQAAFDKWDGAKTKSTAGYALLGVGGAATAASVVLFVLHGNEPVEDTGETIQIETVQPALLPGGAGFTLGGRF